MAEYYDDYVTATRYPFFKLEDEARFFEKLFKGRRLILDLGCGTGRTIRLLEGHKYKFVGVDISKKMLQIAKKHKPGNFVLADIRHLPFVDSTFDAAFSLHGALSHLGSFDEKLLACQEITRVVKRGGLVLIDVRNPYRRDTGDVFVLEWPAGEKKIRVRGYGFWPKEIKEIFGKCCLCLRYLLGDYSLGKKYARDSRRLIAIALKR